MPQSKEPYKDPCPRCGGKTFLEKKGIHVKWSCEKCGYLKFLQQKWTNFVMPFGKHKGDTLYIIAKNDPDYIYWGLNNLRGNIKKRFEEVVEAIEYDGSSEKSD